MKFTRLHIVWFILFIGTFALTLDSCKPKKQEIPPFIDVHLDVKDDQNNPVDSATAYLYTSKEAFDQAYQNSLNLVYNSTGSILTTKIIGGVLDLKELPSNAEYWILVHDDSEYFKDGNTILNYKIDKDNSEAYFKIDGFQNGTIVTANIKLVPVSSLVQFTSTGGPSLVRIGDNLTPVQITAGGYAKVRKGSFGYQARTNTCVWTGAVEALGGQVVSENLATCTTRQIIFFTTQTIDQGKTVNIFIGQNGIKSHAQLSPSSQRDTVLLDIKSNATYFTESSIGNNRICSFQGLIPLKDTAINLDALVLCK